MFYLFLVSYSTKKSRNSKKREEKNVYNDIENNFLNLKNGF